MSEHKVKEAAKQVDSKDNSVVLSGSDKPKGNRRNIKKGSPSTIVLVLLIILVLGAAYVVSNSGHKTKSNFTAKEFRNNLVQLSAEHVTIINKSLAEAIDNPKGVEKSKSKLEGNTRDLTDQVGSIYGQATADSFNKQWNVYIDQLFTYALAAKKNDVSGKSDAKQAILRQSTLPLSKLFAQAQPKYGESVFKAGFGGNAVNMTQLIDDQVNNGDSTVLEFDRQAATEHIKVVFGYLADQTVKQHKDDFRKN